MPDIDSYDRDELCAVIISCLSIRLVSCSFIWNTGSDALDKEQLETWGPDEGEGQCETIGYRVFEASRSC